MRVELAGGPWRRPRAVGSRIRPLRAASRTLRARHHLAAVTIVALVVGACTSSSPEPPPPPPDEEETVDEEPPQGAVPLDAVVVLPGAAELAAGHTSELSASLDELTGQGGDARDLRAVVPDAELFVGDLARTFADRGTPLVCVLGPSSADAVEPLVARYPGARFCAVPSAPDEAQEDAPADPVLRADVRVEELGHLAGLAARQHGGGAAVGVSLLGDELPRERFRRAVLSGLDGVEVVELRGSPEERAATVGERGVRTVLLDGGAGNAELVALLGPGVSVVGPVGLLGGVPLPRRVLSWGVRWQLPIEWVLARSARDGGTTSVSFGLAEDVFELELGPALPPALATDVETARRQLVEGVRDPFAPAPDPPAGDAEDDGPAA